MTHPEASLAGYVDGTLPSVERAAVDAHLLECGRCREEVRAAGGARTALKTLPEVPAPAQIASQALQEARAGRSPRSAADTPRWYRFAGIAGAAAAVLLVLTLALPRIGQNSGKAADGERSAAEAGGAASNPVALAAQQIELQHTNYDSASLTALATSFAAQDAGAGAAASTGAPAASGTQKQTEQALTCIVRSAPVETGQLVRLIEARFQGEPAYLAAFLEGPGAGRPADAVSIWVFATKDCAILSFSNARL